MKIFKRSIPLFFAAFLFICMLPTPANAADPILDDLNMVDIMPANIYYAYANAVTYRGGTAVKPYGYFSSTGFDGGLSSVGWEWNAAGYDNKFDGYYITVYSTSPIDFFTVKLNSGFQVRTTDFKISGNTYSLYVSSRNYNLSQIRITGHFDDAITAVSYGITSCFGVRDVDLDISNLSYRFTYAWYDTGKVTQVVKSYGSSVPLPIDNTYELYDPSQQLDDLTSFFWLPQNLRPLEYAKSIQFLVSTPVDISAELALVDPSTNNRILTVFDGTITEVTSSFKYDNTIQYYEDFYLLSFDLEGYTLGDYMLQLSVTAPSFFTNGADNRAVHLTMHACSMTPVVTNTPWYQIYYSWVKGDLTSITDRVVNAIGSLGSSLNDPESMQDVQDINNSVANKQDQANVINDKMNSVTKPNPSDVTSGTPDISGILSGSSAPLVMSTITGGGNGIFVTVLLLVFTFALVGFIFFGKR